MRSAVLIKELCFSASNPSGGNWILVFPKKPKELLTLLEAWDLAYKNSWFALPKPQHSHLISAETKSNPSKAELETTSKNSTKVHPLATISLSNRNDSF